MSQSESHAAEAVAAEFNRLNLLLVKAGICHICSREIVIDCDGQVSPTGCCCSEVIEFVVKHKIRSLIADLRAQLRESVAVNAKAIKIAAAIDELRSTEGDSLSILCDNPEGPPNNAVEVQADWTEYKERRFTGDTLLAALEAAMTAKRSIKLTEKPNDKSRGAGGSAAEAEDRDGTQ